VSSTAADDAAFREFVTTRWPALVGTAYLITLDRGIAEDCVQEALTTCHRRWSRLRADGNPGGYVHRSVINAALSWRRKRRIREVPLSESGELPVVLAAGGQIEDDDELHRALRSLPPRMRAVIVLRHLEDRSEGETAASGSEASSTAPAHTAPVLRVTARRSRRGSSTARTRPSSWLGAAMAIAAAQRGAR